MPKKVVVNIGERFGRLTLVERVANGHRGATMCRFVCDCGNTVERRLATIRYGHTRSCGCLVVDFASAVGLKHGEARRGRRTPELRAWLAMIARCNNPNDVFYHRYGGRGIRVCDRWRRSFENFLADMGRKPSPEHSIDRKDNDGPYAPENCQWSTPAEQSRNRRTTRMVTHLGRTQCIADWAKELGMSHCCLSERLNRWSVEDAMTRPVRRRVS